MISVGSFRDERGGSGFLLEGHNLSAPWLPHPGWATSRMPLKKPEQELMALVNQQNEWRGLDRMTAMVIAVVVRPDVEFFGDPGSEAPEIRHDEWASAGVCPDRAAGFLLP
jgi:hypothetical protein